MTRHALPDPIVTTGKSDGIRASEIWAKQFVNAQVVSMLNLKLYPAHVARGGKKPVDAAVRFTWDEIFRMSGADPAVMDSNSKQSCVLTVERFLKSAALELQNDQKHPMTLVARAPRKAGAGRGKGAWDKLVVYAYKPSEGKKPSISLGAKPPRKNKPKAARSKQDPDTTSNN